MPTRPKPTAIKIAEGNRGKRKITSDDIQPEHGIPERPKRMSLAARREWDFLCEYLNDLGVLTVADGKALWALCVAYAQSEIALKKLNEQGAVTAVYGLNKNGERVHLRYEINPWHRVYGDYLKLQRMFLLEFGLTPASRSRIKLPPEPKKDPFDALFKAKAEHDAQPVGFHAEEPTLVNRDIRRI